MSILEASLAYAARGLAIFPVRGKLPLTKRGFHDATTDPRIIREWYAGWPDAGIGLPTGAVNGRIVVDVDDDEAFEAFQRDHGRLPSTATVLTPRGGRHLYYRHPGNGHVVRSVAGFCGFVGLDVRGDGGYVVVPPSPGYTYELGTEDVADAPAVLLEDAPPRNRPPATETTLIFEGARNATLASEAGRLRRLGMSEAVIEAALLALNNERCRPLLSTDEVRRIAASIARYPVPEGSVAVTPSSRNSKRDEPYAANGTRRTSQSSRLVELCADVELFHARDGEAYGTVAVDDHRETWPVLSSVFRDFLRRRYFDAHGAVPGAQPLGEAVDLLAARGRFSRETREVDLRLAGHEGRIYLDLCDDDWGVVEIGGDGWRVVADAPVRFRRARGMLPLPTPTPGGSLELLRPFLNVGDDERRWKLIVGWLVGLFHPGGPYAVLAVSGEQGSAKTTQGRILRALHDPNESPDRTTPRSELDLAIAARNGRIIVLDNMSGLKPWLSDGLARLATGSGLTTRKLYTDDEETIFHACRPILLNGIAEVPTRSDLLDRSLVVDLPRIPDERRQLESDLWSAFEQVRPGILGALLTAASCALEREQTVTVPGWPRMADFARWVTAAEPALGWEPGSFMEAYSSNRAASHELALDFAAIYAPLQQVIDTDAWQGTASELLAALDDKVEDGVTRQEGWPKSPRALSGHLRDLAPNLRAVGLGVEFSRQAGSGRRRLITITRITGRDRPDRPDRPEDADSSANAAEPGTQRDGEADRRDVTPEPSGPASERDRDERDGRDANGGLLDGSEQVEDQMLRATLSALPGAYLENQPAPSSQRAHAAAVRHGPR